MVPGGKSNSMGRSPADIGSLKPASFCPLPDHVERSQASWIAYCAVTEARGTLFRTRRCFPKNARCLG